MLSGSDDRWTWHASSMRHGDSFDEFPAWVSEGIYQHLKGGNALLSISAEDPDLLKDQDQELIGVSMKTRARHMAPGSNLVTSNAINWNIISYAIPSWARKIFPGLSDQQAVDKLWETIFNICGSTLLTRSQPGRLTFSSWSSGQVI